MKIEFDQIHFQREMNKLRHEIENDIIKSLQQAGEKFARDAKKMKKSEGGFGDVSGNLRSSIGYVIRHSGEIIFSDFTGKPEGVEAGKKAADEVEKNKGFQLIGVAGMEYAEYVESKGFNVITQQGLMMVVDLTKYFKAIEQKYNR